MIYGATHSLADSLLELLDVVDGIELNNRELIVPLYLLFKDGLGKQSARSQRLLRLALKFLQWVQQLVTDAAILLLVSILLPAEHWQPFVLELLCLSLWDRRHPDIYPQLLHQARLQNAFSRRLRSSGFISCVAIAAFCLRNDPPRALPLG